MGEALGRILVVDDEHDLRALLQRYLSDQGYAVRALDGGQRLEHLLGRERFDVLVLDVMMPGEDGLSLCRRLRAQGETIPIVMLTARGDPLDRIIGLEMGADDYLPKPFNPRELQARIEALIRRQRMLGAHSGPLPGDGRIDFGPFSLHLGERRLSRDGRDIPLTSGEFALLQALARHPRRPLGRDRLIELSRGRDHEASDRSIDVQVMRLRRAIEDDPAQPRYIRTVWGLGYVFMPDGRAEERQP
ncbi:two-component system response regulator OmpR [Azotobacter beijerinckii]|uniref:Two-component system, OmpR family, phosphate regulon response regulator OmpR n=1 Tax=Azotobacter beijerinckii TaxID=170623 RepID=A0A1I4F592_9GAMM|nr:two-component system response regulator OmpR [Azotobacter beijerinckii]SEJ40033.1 two-component system, OmpR family, phosphate regulon response regulator OmpR [Azotobacter beijerinckii]SFB42909.1 two-component system, OmpR family, phosphate regulon response regulator OmpR [Azotobacter beijerinckii]SFL13155.1 two-component system, OmpR family, phosphate regulon response regulator OmpR [Azotobacter beijerinckii]